MTNLKAVPKKSTDLGGGNAAWGKRVADISRNPNLLSQKPAGYYAEALIKQAESAVELLDGDSCANGPPWCREVLENVWQAGLESSWPTSAMASQASRAATNSADCRNCRP